MPFIQALRVLRKVLTNPETTKMGLDAYTQFGKNDCLRSNRRLLITNQLTGNMAILKYDLDVCSFKIIASPHSYNMANPTAYFKLLYDKSSDEPCRHLFSTYIMGIPFCLFLFLFQMKCLLTK